MERDTTFKEHYFWELQRRDSLNSSLSFLVGIVTLLLGASFSMAKGIKFEWTVRNIISALPVASTTTLLLISIYFIVRAYTGYRWAHFPHTVDLIKSKREFIEHYKSLGHNDEIATQRANSEFIQGLDERYAENCDENGKNNDRKAKWILWANRLIVAALLSFSVQGMVYFYQSRITPEEPARVTITNFKEIAVTDNKPTPPTPPPTTSQQVQTPPPTKPAIPPSRIVMDGANPPIKK